MLIFSLTCSGSLVHIFYHDSSSWTFKLRDFSNLYVMLGIGTAQRLFFYLFNKFMFEFINNKKSFMFLLFFLQLGSNCCLY